MSNPLRPLLAAPLAKSDISVVLFGNRFFWSGKRWLKKLIAALVSLSGLTYPAVGNGVVTFACSLFLMGKLPPVLKLALVSNKSHIRRVFCSLIHVAVLSPTAFWPHASLRVQRLPPVIDCCPVARASAQGGAWGTCPGLADQKCK